MLSNNYRNHLLIVSRGYLLFSTPSQNQKLDTRSGPGAAPGRCHLISLRVVRLGLVSYSVEQGEGAAYGPSDAQRWRAIAHNRLVYPQGLICSRNRLQYEQPVNTHTRPEPPHNQCVTCRFRLCRRPIIVSPYAVTVPIPPNRPTATDYEAADDRISGRDRVDRVVHSPRHGHVGPSASDLRLAVAGASTASYWAFSRELIPSCGSGSEYGTYETAGTPFK